MRRLKPFKEASSSCAGSYRFVETIRRLSLDIHLPTDSGEVWQNSGPTGLGIMQDAETGTLTLVRLDKRPPMRRRNHAPIMDLTLDCDSDFVALAVLIRLAKK